MKKKQILIIFLFLGMFIAGTVLMLTVPTSIKITYGKTIKTQDGESIAFNVVEPRTSSDTKKKAVIIGHGVMVNKEMMKGYAIELAAAGYVAVPIDFRGHGQSSGTLDPTKLVNDVKAVKGYLAERDDIDIHNLGYIGYSMGGGPGNQIVKEDDDFKCFIGVGTSLRITPDDLDANRTLNILMILARFDQAFPLGELKEQFGDYIGKNNKDVVVNRLYGSFQEGNAAKIFLDDNSDHLTTAWDQDFLREARDWVMNTFDEVDPVDQTFYANYRFLILLLQLMGGLGFFFTICGPISEFILGSEKRDKPFIELELPDRSWQDITKSSLLYSFIFLIPGTILMIPILLFFPLIMAGGLLALLFGQAFGFLMYLRKNSEGKKHSIMTLIKKPFQLSKSVLLRQVIVGVLLAVLLYFILYLSIGLNYLGILPSIVKLPWIPIYFALTFVIFILFHVLFNVVLYKKFRTENFSLVKTTGVALTILITYLSAIVLIPCIITGNFFLTLILIVSIPIYILLVVVAAVIYTKTHSIIPGAIINTSLLVCILSTLSPLAFALPFLTLF